MKKIPKPAFTIEFREHAVKRVVAGETNSAMAKELGLSDQTLRNWVKAAAAGKLVGAGSKVVTPEAMELAGFNRLSPPMRCQNGSVAMRFTME